MSEWKEDNLGNLAEVQTGPFGSQLKNEQYITGGTPVVTVEHIKDFFIEDFTYPSVTDEDKNTLKRYILKSGDIVFSRVGSVDLSALVKEHQDGWLFSSRMLRVRVKEKLDTQFLSYYLRQSTIRQFILNISVGSTMPSINTEILKSLPIVYCSLKEQKQIADILSCLDNKIDNLRRQNETLEKIAQTLFKHWFIDFEFPNDDGKPYKSSGGAMVASELGDIPAGWRVGKMQDIIEVRDGTHDSPKQSDKGFKLITSKHLKKEGIDFDSAYFISDNDYVEINKRSKVETFDILLSMIGTVGLLYFVQEKLINFAIKNIGLFKTSQNLNYSEYIYLFIKSNYGETYLKTRLAGTTQSYVTLSALRDMPLIIPSSRIVNQFKQISKSIFDKDYFNKQQIQTLTKTRDTLLPKLMSGQIRVKEVESIIEEVK